MKSFVACVFFLLGVTAPVWGQDDAIVKYFSKYIDDERFVHAYVSPRMFSAVAKLEEKDMSEELKSIIRDLKGMRILSIKNSGRKYFDEYTKAMDTKGYETVYAVGKKSENVKIYLRNENKPDGELLMVHHQDDSCTLTSFFGKVNLDRMAKLSASLNISGAEHLQKIPRKK